MSILQEGWKKFKDKVIPKDASPVQVRDMKRAFYAGAMVTDGYYDMFSRPEISEDEGVSMIQKYKEEIDLFFVDVKEGRA